MSQLITFRLEEALVKEVDRERRPRGLSRAEVIRRALDLWIARQRLDHELDREQIGYSKHPVEREEFRPVLGAQAWPK